VKQYFKFYSKLGSQQNMIQDTVRTELYRNSIMKNPSNYKDKIVLDVGCGSGILSMFAAQAGAKRVYAVEASNMADYAKRLVAHNKLDKIVCVIHSTIEDLELPEKVDTIISEPLGTFLLNERMLETFVIARNKFLKPEGGRMFPTRADLYLMPFQDQTLVDE
jgi:type I protein arginine methyltransferase